MCKVKKKNLLHKNTTSTTRSIMLMMLHVQPKERTRTLLRPPLSSLSISHRPSCLQTLKAPRVLGHRIGDALTVEQIRLLVQIRDIVALLVVVDVVGDAGFPAKQLGLVGRLEDLGAREEPTGGDAVLDEGGVVGAAAERGGDKGLAVGAVVGFKLLFDGGGAGGAGEVEGAAVAVVDAVDVIGTGNL